MNPAPENFDALRRMLALKRHEQPPPGYFDRLPNLVVARLRAGDQGRRGSVLERLFDETPWLQRLVVGLLAKPVFAGAFGIAVCALLVSGVVYSENVEPGQLRSSLTVNDASPVLVSAPESDENPLPGSALAISTNPVPVGTSLFEQAQPQFEPQTVNYMMPAGN